jgi:hypothetical protein
MFKPLLLAFLILFITPLAVGAGLYVAEDRPSSWGRADWSSAGMLPSAASVPEARVLVLAGRTGRWKGVFAVHTWIVVKPENATRWTRYDVVGWGNPLRKDGWDADGRWFSDPPRVVADIRGADAAAAIPKIEAAIKAYTYRNAGDYRAWPGPNSNTFVATVLRAVPELQVAMLPNAIGKDYHDGIAAGLTASRTGIEASLWGLLGFKLGWVEGIELNVLGLVAGLDLRQPAVKLPGFGRIALLGQGTPTTTSAVTQ